MATVAGQQGDTCAARQRANSTIVRQIAEMFKQELIMTQTPPPDEAAIRAATEQLSGLLPTFATRFAAARDLLVRGDWEVDGTTLYFPGSATVIDGQCDRQERSAVVCLHEVAARILTIANQRLIARTAGS